MLPNRIRKRIEARHPIRGQRKSVRAKCRRPVDGDAPRALARPLDGGRGAAARRARGRQMVTCRKSADGDVKCSRQPADDNAPRALASPLDGDRGAAARRARGRQIVTCCKLSATADACPERRGATGRGRRMVSRRAQSATASGCTGCHRARRPAEAPGVDHGSARRARGRRMVTPLMRSAPHLNGRRRPGPPGG